MALIDQVNRVINRLRPARPKTTADDQSKSGGTTPGVMRLRLDYDRRSLIKDSRKMYADDSRIEGIINTLARDAVKGGFTVKVKQGSNPKLAQQVADEMVSRLHLATRLDDWTRLTLRDGDSFLENSVDSDFLIQEVTRKPTLEMNRNSNKTDHFDDPQRAYWWGEANFGGMPPKEAVWFADWQIVHARWGHDEGSRYGKPLFSSGRTSHRYTVDGERDIWVRRRTRAGMKFVHKIQGDQAAVQQYLDRNKDVLNNPNAAIQDFFGNVEVSAIQGDARLGEISDVKHHIETWAVGSPVPLTLIGYGAELNRDILEQKKEQYDDALEQVAEWVSDQFLRPLLELQWLLQGIWPGGMDYSIAWGSKKLITTEDLFNVARAGLQFRALGWPDEIIVEILAPFIPGLDAERLLKAIEALQAGQPDEVGRIAATAGQG